MKLGTDVSHWQDDSTTVREIDFVKMRSAGAEFTIIKATHGLSTDHVFKNSWGDAKRILPRGAYHWLNWNKPGLEQAKYYCDTIAYDLPEIPPAVDYEDRIGIPPNAIGHLWSWVDYVESQLNRVPIIYTAPYFWMEYGSTDKAWARYLLWIANYYVLKPMIPKPWSVETLWQKTPKGDGAKYGVESLQIDLDEFNGTDAEFATFCGGDLPPAPADRLSILWREANDHPPTGWNLEP